jgi:hypothetical protein
MSICCPFAAVSVAESGRDGFRPPSGLPARRYSWPPFEAANTAAVKHSAYVSPMLRPEHRAEVEEIASDVWSLLPEGLQLERYTLGIEGLACRIWQARRAYADLSEAGVVRGADRQPAPILRYLGTLERAIQRDLEAFGLTTKAAAELGLDLIRAADVLGEYLDAKHGGGS